MKLRLNRRGTIMGLSLGLIAVMSTLGTAFLVRSLTEDRLAGRALVRHRAFYLADAAVDQASLNLRTDDPADDVWTMALPTGTAQIDNPVTPLGNMRWQVTTRGTADTDQRRIEAIFALTRQSVFEFAIFGDLQVNVTGRGITTSYDSRLGPYNDDPTDPAYNAGHNGDVGTNATTVGGVTAGGSIFVDGQVAVGAGVANPVSVVSGYQPAFITGGTDPPSDTQDVVAQTFTFPMPAVTVPGYLTCSDFTVNGNTTIVLPPGEYCYNNLTIEGGAELLPDVSAGPGGVKIYLTGALTARGNSTVGLPSDPRKLNLLVTQNGQATLQEGTITGSTGFYGGIYAPDATINITGNADVYGSIIAKQVNLTGSATIHYDEAMTDVTDISNEYTRSLVSWRELQ